MLDDFHWLRPEWFGILPILFLITFGFARRKLRMGSWFRLIDPKLVPYVLLREQNKETSFQWWLLFLGGLLAVSPWLGQAGIESSNLCFDLKKRLLLRLTYPDQWTPKMLVRVDYQGRVLKYWISLTIERAAKLLLLSIQAILLQLPRLQPIQIRLPL